MSRNLAFRRDGLRVFILRTVFCDGFGPKKKAIIARCFCPGTFAQETPEFLPKAPVRNNSPPLWQAAGRQVGRRVCVWVCGGVVVVAGWLAGMVHGA